MSCKDMCQYIHLSTRGSSIFLRWWEKGPAGQSVRPQPASRPLRWWCWWSAGRQTGYTTPLHIRLFPQPNVLPLLYLLGTRQLTLLQHDDSDVVYKPDRELFSYCREWTQTPEELHSVWECEESLPVLRVCHHPRHGQPHLPRVQGRGLGQRHPPGPARHPQLLRGGHTLDTVGRRHQDCGVTSQQCRPTPPPSVVRPARQIARCTNASTPGSTS